MSETWDAPFPEPGDEVRARRHVVAWLTANDWPRTMPVTLALIETIAVVYFEHLASEDEEMDLGDVDYKDYAVRVVLHLLDRGHTTLSRDESGIRLVLSAANSAVAIDLVEAERAGSHQAGPVLRPPDHVPVWITLNWVASHVGDPRIDPRVLLETIRDVQESDACVEFGELGRVLESRARVFRSAGRNDSARRTMASAIRAEMETPMPAAGLQVVLAEWEVDDGLEERAHATLHQALRSVQYVLGHPRAADGFALPGGLRICFGGLIDDLERIVEIVKRCSRGTARTALEQAVHETRAANGLFGEILP